MSSKNNNKINVPEARAAMDKFKMEAASEVGVNLKEGLSGLVCSMAGWPAAGNCFAGQGENLQESFACFENFLTLYSAKNPPFLRFTYCKQGKKV